MYRSGINVPVMEPKSIVQMLRNFTARMIFREHPEIKRELWGCKLWTSGYYINIVGLFGNEKIIKKYVKEQGDGLSSNLSWTDNNVCGVVH